MLHLIWKSRSRSLEEEWRGTESMFLWSFHSHWWFGLLCHLLVLDLLLKALWRCWFHFPAGLGICPHFQRYQKLVQWPWCYCAWLASKLAWPEPHRESMGYCQEEDERHQTQQCRWSEGCYQSNMGFQYTWAVPRADCLHAMPNWCSNSCKRRPNQVLSAEKWTNLSEAWHFCLKCPFFIDLM